MALLEPEVQTEDRAQQIDVRFSKLVRIGRTRIRGRFDVYNVMNADDVLTQNQVIPTGTSTVPFRRPTTVLPGRTFKLGATVDFYIADAEVG